MELKTIIVLAALFVAFLFWFGNHDFFKSYEYATEQAKTINQ